MYQYEKFEPSEVIEYLRKSRSDDPLLSTEEVLSKHETLLGEWIGRNLDGPIPEENIYREIVSGETIKDRPCMLEILKRIESPAIRAILVVEVQRLSRGDLEDCGKLMKLLRYTNTKVITPMKIYDLSDDYDRDAFERELKRGNDYLEYTKKIMGRGRLLAVQAGCFIGNTAPYGYDKDIIMQGRKKLHTLKVNEEQAEVVKMIFDMFVAKDMGLQYIANKLNEMHIPAPRGEIWTYVGLRELISNRHYIGKVVWNRRQTVVSIQDMQIKSSRPVNPEPLIFDGLHPAIITEAMFTAAQEKKGRSARCGKYIKRPTTMTNILTGLIFCGKCGHSVILRTYSQKGKFTPLRAQCNRQAQCDSGSILAEDVYNSIRQSLTTQIEEFTIELENQGDKNAKKKQIEMLEAELKRLQQKSISLWDKYTSEDMPRDVFVALSAKTDNDKANIQKQLTEAISELDDTDYEQKIATFRQAITCIDDDTVTPEDKNRFLKACIKKITLTVDRPHRVHGGEGTHGWSLPKSTIDIELNI